MIDNLDSPAFKTQVPTKDAAMPRTVFICLCLVVSGMLVAISGRVGYEIGKNEPRPAVSFPPFSPPLFSFTDCDGINRLVSTTTDQTVIVVGNGCARVLRDWHGIHEAQKGGSNASTP